MDQVDMTIDEFEDLTFMHGADPAKWPKGACERAVTLLDASPSAAAILARAHELEAALATAMEPDPAPSVELLGRILAGAATVQPVSAPVTPTRPAMENTVFSSIRLMLSPAAACAASAVLGLWLGYAGPVDFADVAVGALGDETTTEFALLDDIDASTLDGVIDVLEASE